MTSVLAEQPMAKKRAEKAPTSDLVTIKIARTVHTKLRVIAASQERDMSDLLTELVEPLVDKVWKAEVAKQSEQAKGGKA